MFNDEEDHIATDRNKILVHEEEKDQSDAIKQPKDDIMICEADRRFMNVDGDDDEIDR